MSEQDWNPSQYYQADFLANHSVQPGSDEARKMTVTSGLKCSELYRRSDPVGSLVRMLLESSAWRSTKCFLTWKASATPAKRLLFRLVPSMPRTDETVVPFWPTPTARDCKGANSMEPLTRDGKKNHTDQLANAVKLWPTPSASDCGRTAINPILTSNGTIRHRNKAGGAELRTAGCCGSYVSNADGPVQSIPMRTRGGWPGSGNIGWWPAEPGVGRVAHGVPNRVDRLKCLGNAVVPQWAYPYFRGIAELEGAWQTVST